MKLLLVLLVVPGLQMLLSKFCPPTLYVHASVDVEYWSKELVLCVQWED